MLKAVLFDMDGVIVDTEPLHRKAYFLMFKDMDIAVTEAMYTSYTGQSTMNICKQLVAYFNLDAAPQTLVAIKRKHFKYLFENDTLPATPRWCISPYKKLLQQWSYPGFSLVGFDA